MHIVKATEKKKIRLLILDVDGTLTDGKIYMGTDGEVMKAFNIKDGYGIHDMLPCINEGIIPVIITGRKSKILENRCKELGILELYQGVSDKILILDSLIREKDIQYENVAYIGDDVNDLVCMKKCAIVGCPHDAAKEILEIADFISERNGGEGAVREYIEWLSH